MRILIPVTVALLAIGPTAARSAVPAPLLVGGIRAGEGAGLRTVEILHLNRSDRPEDYVFPARIAGEWTVDGRVEPVVLERVSAGDRTQHVPASGFARRDYRLRVPDGAGAVARLSLQPGRMPADMVALAAPAAPAAPAAVPAAPAPATDAAFPAPVAIAAAPESGNAFLGNLSSYGPIYGAYGPGTDTAARIEIGFKYQLFGQAGDVGASSPRVNGVFFGYRQRLFWDLGSKSSPFRNVEYMPEIFYLVPATPLSDRLTVGGQAGARHESNGRDGTASRSLNTLYIQPVATVPVGSLSLTVGPRVWAYVGSLEDNPDLKRYRGNSGLFAEIGTTDGWRLTTNSRMSFGSGKGALDAELSYPLNRIVDTKLNLYLFGQGFVGYGENLLDYNRRATRLRIGVGFVR